MKKKNLILLLLFYVLLNAVNAQDTSVANETFTLQQCIEIAIKNNLQVRQSEFQSESEKVNWQRAKGNMLPSVNAFVSHGISQGRSIDPFSNGYVDQNVGFANYGLNADVNLWNGFGIRNNAQSNQLSYEAARMDWQQQKDNATINVILAYLLVLENQEQLSAAKQQAEVTRKQAERLEIMNREGATAPATYYDMKGQLAADELLVVNFSNDVETAKLNLLQLMNIPYLPNMQLKKINEATTLVMYNANPEQIYQQALQNLALVKAADLRSESAEKGVKAARGLLLPTLSLSGSLGTNYSSVASLSLATATADIATNNYVLINNEKVPVYAPQSSFSNQKIGYGDQWKNNFNSSISVNLSIPILNSLIARSRLNQAKILEKRTEFEASTTKIQLRQNIEQAYVNMTTAFERYQKLEEQVKDFTESFRAAEIRFNEGASTSVDYQIVKNNLDRAKINLIAAKYDYALRVQILDFYQGKL